MNLSALLVALVPPAVVAVTSTAVLALPAGLTTVQEVLLPQFTCVPATAPKSKLVPVVPLTKLLPVTVTDVPPAEGPLVGLIFVTAGRAR